MESKRRVLAVLAVLSLIQASGCGRTYMTLSRPALGYGARAEKKLSLPLDLAAGRTLALACRTAQFEVEVSADGESRLDVSLVAYARSKEDAQALVERFGPVAKRSDGRITIESTGEPLVYSGVFGTTTISPSVRYHAVVPAGTLLDVDLRSGSVRARGPLGACKLATGFGSVDVVGVEGNVDAESDSGDVELHNLRGESVRAISGFGDVTLGEIEAKQLIAKTDSGHVSLSDAEGDRIELGSDFGGMTVNKVKGSEVTADTDSGQVEFDDVRAEHMVVGSDFGSLTLTNLVGEVTAKTSSGTITLSSAEGGPWDLRSDFGAVRVRNAAGNLLAHSESGTIRVAGFSGQVDARTAFGQVVLDGVFSNLSAVTSSGRVKVNARAGSAVATPWKLHSGFGRLELRIPKDFSCQLDASTGHGNIQVNVPMRTEKAQYGSNKRVSGILGSGGETVTLETASGEIRIQDSDL